MLSLRPNLWSASSFGANATPEQSGQAKQVCPLPHLRGLASKICRLRATTDSMKIGWNFAEVSMLRSIGKVLLYVCCMSAMFAVAYAADAEAPTISVQGDSEIDFGAYPAKLRKEVAFIIRNTGGGVLKIGRIRKTCGCAGAQIDRTEIPSGEHATLKAVIIEDSIYGPYRKNVYVESNDPARRFLTLTLSGNAMPLVSVMPSDTLYAGILQSGIEWGQEFLLDASEEGVVFSDPVVQSDVVHSLCMEKKNPKLFRVKISIIPSGENDAFSCKIIIPIAEPEGWKPLEINIRGRVKQGNR
ncbi:MAG: DUF1573 domain-containing protein [Victivallales bacterium]|nr:DUF1573 domain-containing protein [Victivallales bacterium]